MKKGTKVKVKNKEFKDIGPKQEEMLNKVMGEVGVVSLSNDISEEDSLVSVDFPEVKLFMDVNDLKEV